MSQKAMITGTGVISSLANSATTLHSALCAGHCGLGPIGLFDVSALSCKTGGEVRDFDASVYLGDGNLRPLDRIAQLSTTAAHLALVNSGWTKEMCKQQDVGIVLGTVFSSVRTIGTFDRVGITRGPRFVKPLDFANTVINSATGQTAIWHNLRGINSTMATGTSSGLHALGYASDLIRSGRSPVLLAGGSEELCFEMLFGFDRAGLLSDQVTRAVPFDVGRTGFLVGEGAAFLMIESAESAQGRGAEVLGEIKGYGQAFDPSRGQQIEKTQAAMVGAIQAALNSAGVGTQDIDCISASANGSVQTDRCEARAIATCFGSCLATLPVTSIKSGIGETLGASGAIQTVALLEAMRLGVLPGICGLTHIEEGLLIQASKENREASMKNGLVLSFGFDGNMCALVVSR